VIVLAFILALIAIAADGGFTDESFSHLATKRLNAPFVEELE